MPPVKQSDWLVAPIAPHARLLFKPLENCQSEGCHLDVRVPSGGAGDERGCPVAIFIHGGGFTVGSSMDIGFNQVQWLLERGVACVSIEYRLLPHVTHVEIRQDVLDAYVFIQNKLQEEVKRALPDAPTLDVSRCFVTGGSAGGTCSLMLGADIYTHNQTAPHPLPPLRAVLSAFPLVDANSHFCTPNAQFKAVLEAEHPETYRIAMQVYDEKVCVSEPYLPDVFTQDPPRTPRQMFIKGASITHTLNSFLYGCDAPYPSSALPIHAATASYPPTWLYCAIEDDLIPVQQSYDMADRLRALGVEVHAEGVQAPHGYTDLPMRYFPERGQAWWTDSILPSLEWVMGKLK